MGFFLYYIINVMITMIRTTQLIIIKTLCKRNVWRENYYVGLQAANGI